MLNLRCLTTHTYFKFLDKIFLYLNTGNSNECGRGLSNGNIHIDFNAITIVNT